jgi:rare lipoprotein A
VRYPTPGQTEEGIASYYDGEFVGRRTANGEVMARDRLTAAHRTYVFGTVVRVTNLENGRETVVRINDRGPFVDDRIIDLTLAGARAIDMVGSGTAKVRLEVLGAPPPGTPMWVQIGAFIDPQNAERLRERFSESFPATVVVEGEFHKVRLGPCAQERDARIMATRARQLGVPAIIVVEK